MYGGLANSIKPINPNQDSLGYKIGKIGGDIGSLIFGGGAIAVGTAGEVGGVALDSTGVGAIAGVPINVASAAAISYGTVVVVKSANDLVNDAKNLFTGSSGGSKGELPSRNGALNQAKRDAGIPRNQEPSAVESVPMRAAPYEGGHVIKDSNGNIIYTREYHYTNKNGQEIIIQEHSAGHIKGGQESHFNVRPADNPRTGSVPGTQDHYPFNK